MEVLDKLPVKATRSDIVERGRNLSIGLTDTNIGLIYGAQALPMEIYLKLIWFYEKCPWRIAPEHKEVVLRNLKTPASDFKEFYSAQYGRQILNFALAGSESYQSQRGETVLEFEGLVSNYQLRKERALQDLASQKIVQLRPVRDLVGTISFSHLSEEKSVKETKKLLDRITPEEFFRYENTKGYF